MNRYQLVRTAGLLLAGLVLAGCDANIARSDSWAWWDRGRISRTIAAGTTSTVEERSTTARAGQTIVVTYQATVREGSVQIDIWRPLNVSGGTARLASVTLRETRDGTLTATVDETLSYQIRVRPFRFAGAYEVSWTVQ
jgi:hypothetical protein